MSAFSLSMASLLLFSLSSRSLRDGHALAAESERANGSRAGVNPSVPLHLLLQPLCLGLRLHLLDLNGVGAPAASVQLVVARAHLHDALVDPQSWNK